MRAAVIIILLMHLLFQQKTMAENPAITTIEEKPVIKKIRVGTEDKRQPYTYLTKEQSHSGLLVKAVNDLCEIEKIECQLSTNNFYDLLEDLQGFKLNVMILVDSLVLPEIDNVLLSNPFCNINSVFIQQQSRKTRIKKEDFKQATIGVLKGSLHHFYLLDEYSSLARLKAYELLESGILDLVFGRIDALLADEAFFKARIKNTSLGNEDKAERLIAINVEEPKLPPTAMRLAVRKEDTELLAVLEKNIPDNPPSCVELIKDNETASVINNALAEQEAAK